MVYSCVEEASNAHKDAPQIDVLIPFRSSNEGGLALRVVLRLHEEKAGTLPLNLGSFSLFGKEKN